MSANDTIFSLEALEAKHGDSLLLHFGPAKAPKIILLDGGPSGVYGARLRPRLEQLGKKQGDGPLKLAAVIVSHLDDDHIRGILDLTNKLVEADDDGGKPLCRIGRLWHNSFDDIVGDANVARLDNLASRLDQNGAALPASVAGAVAVVSSVGQGRGLRDNARRLALTVNEGARILTAGRTISIEPDLKLRILGPSEERVRALHKEWDKVLVEKDWAVEASALAQVAEYVDKSVYNLSSLIILAELGKKRMLLTGDARGDDIIASLGSADLLTKGKCHVDLLKVPHHGSDNNVSTAFFRTVTADEYVISGNGEYGNPETATLQMLLEARGASDFRVHLTNRTGRNNLATKLTKFLNKLPAAKRKRFLFRDKKDPAIRVDL